MLISFILPYFFTVLLVFIVCNNMENKGSGRSEKRRQWKQLGGNHTGSKSSKEEAEDFLDCLSKFSSFVGLNCKSVQMCIFVDAHGLENRTNI